jgi:hypothetical protein
MAPGQQQKYWIFCCFAAVSSCIHMAGGIQASPFRESGQRAFLLLVMIKLGL